MPYQLYNYTWRVINEAGDVVSATSLITFSIPWTPLEVDLCQLAVGAGEAWDTPSHYMPQTKLVTTQTRYSTVPACYNKWVRSFLSLTSIYVCPGDDREQSLGQRCGYRPQHFCASWGYETTGDTYWNPSLSWDLIQVKRHEPPT